MIQIFDKISSERITSRVFTFSDRYSEILFQGNIPDTGAPWTSTTGEPQFRALQRLDSNVTFDKLTAGRHRIHFGKGEVISLGKAQVNTPVGLIEF